MMAVFFRAAGRDQIRQAVAVEIRPDAGVCVDPFDTYAGGDIDERLSGVVQEEPRLRVDQIINLRDEHVFEAVEIDVRDGDARPQFVAFVDAAAADGQGGDTEGVPPVGEDAFLVVEDGGIVADVSADIVVHV